MGQGNQTNFIFRATLQRTWNYGKRNISWHSNRKSGKISKIIKVILIAGTFDLPARCLVSGSIQFNGKYGCVKCFQSGASFKTASGGTVWIYLFNKDDPSGHARNNTSFKFNALEAYHENKPKFGIKYPTWLHGNGVGKITCMVL